MLVQLLHKHICGRCEGFVPKPEDISASLIQRLKEFRHYLDMKAKLGLLYDLCSDIASGEWISYMMWGKGTLGAKYFKFWVSIAPKLQTNNVVPNSANFWHDPNFCGWPCYHKSKNRECLKKRCWRSQLLTSKCGQDGPLPLLTTRLFPAPTDLFHLHLAHIASAVCKRDHTDPPLVAMSVQFP